MQDIEYADTIELHRAFKEYVSAYDPSDPKIALKIAHITRVAKISKNMAEKLTSDQSQIELAEVIGFLHDIGRFEQIRRYDTFSDAQSVDHGSFGVEILYANDKQLLRKFVADDRFDDVIITAIKNHNKATISNPDDMDDITLFHSRLIRDTDKIDNYKTSMDEPNIALYGREDISKDILTKELLDDFFDELGLLDYSKMNDSAADRLLGLLAYSHDLNFDESYDEILRQGHLQRLYDIHFDDEETNQSYRMCIDDTIALCKTHGVRKN